MTMEKIKSVACFGGVQQVWRHDSAALKCGMEFAVYLPPQAESGAKLPTLFWLSGLTCTWANATDKAGFQRLAAEHGMIVVLPDTSPRGVNLPGEDDSYDFGAGAGFYVNATQSPWDRHYRMFDYVSDELPELIYSNFPADAKRTGIFGHSMGGHGALICALKKPERFRSCSAFAPICAPTRCPWGEKALGGYLGPDRELWKAYDACELAAASGFRGEILADQGGADEFLATQLRPEFLREALGAAGIGLRYREHPGYDHSYYFIASFAAEHFAHHAGILSA